MEIKGRIWTAPNDVLILLQEDGTAIHVTETICRMELWGKVVKIMVVEEE